MESISLPEKIRELIRLIKVWCDEWEDLGIPDSLVVRYLKGRGSARRYMLKNTMDVVYRVLTSKIGTCVLSPSQLLNRLDFTVASALCCRVNTDIQNRFPVKSVCHSSQNQRMNLTDDLSKPGKRFNRLNGCSKTRQVRDQIGR